MYEVGEVVKVKDIGKRYSTYYNWFDLHARDVRPSVVALYGSDDYKELYTKMKYKIIAKGKHEHEDTMLYLLWYDGDQDRASYYSHILLMGEEGIKTPPKKMTVKEIESELGYEIELVE